MYFEVYMYICIYVFFRLSPRVPYIYVYIYLYIYNMFLIFSTLASCTEKSYYNNINNISDINEMSQVRGSTPGPTPSRADDGGTSWSTWSTREGTATTGVIRGYF